MIRFFYLLTDGFDTKQSLLMNIIGCMEQLLLSGSADPANSGQLDDSQDLLDYRVWEAKTTQKYKVCAHYIHLFLFLFSGLHHLISLSSFRGWNENKKLTGSFLWWAY